MELPARVLALLQERGETVATAESLTGGRLAAALTGVPGASKSYVGGVVAYATSVKQDLLGVPASLVERYGVISAECALAMARGAAGVTGAAWGIGTTGRGRPRRAGRATRPGPCTSGWSGRESRPPSRWSWWAAGRRSRTAPAWRHCRRSRACFPPQARDEPREDARLG